MTENLTITRVETKDLQPVLDLQKLVFQSEAKLVNNYSIPPLTQTLEQLHEDFNKGTILKAFFSNDPDKIIGSARAYSDRGTAFIGRFMVHPDYQNQGIGKKLISAIENHYPGLSYELFTSSLSIKNIALYKKQGYSEYKRETHDGIEFIFLRK